MQWDVKSTATHSTWKPSINGVYELKFWGEKNCQLNRQVKSMFLYMQLMYTMMWEVFNLECDSVALWVLTCVSPLQWPVLIFMDWSELMLCSPGQCYFSPGMSMNLWPQILENRTNINVIWELLLITESPPLSAATYRDVYCMLDTLIGQEHRVPSIWPFLEVIPGFLQRCPVRNDFQLPHIYWRLGKCKGLQLP